MSRKREVLLETAADLFQQYGLRRVSVEDICRSAKVSKATFYKYFANKTAVIAVFLPQYINCLAEAQYAVMQTPGADFAARFRRMMQLDRQQLHDMPPPLLQDLLDPTLSEVHELMQQLIGAHRDRLAALVREGQARGVFNPDFPLDFFFFVQTQMLDLFQNPQLQALEPDITRRAELIADFLTYGLMAPPRD